MWILRVTLSLCYPGSTRFVGRTPGLVVDRIGKLVCACVHCSLNFASLWMLAKQYAQSNMHAYVSGAAERRLRFGSLRGLSLSTMLAASVSLTIMHATGRGFTFGIHGSGLPDVEP